MTLYKLTELGAYPNDVLLTTNELAKALGMSQQSASRHLIELEKSGLIKRTKVTRRETIQVTENGVKHLGRMYLSLKQIFEPQMREIIVEGEVFTGLGEGRYYMTQEGYRKQIQQKLGFDPFPGTLNARVRPEFVTNRRMIDASPFILVEGFTNGTRSFGAVKVIRARINNEVDGALLLPVRTHYGEDVFELISAENLRKRLKLKDGDVVRAHAIISSSQESSAVRRSS
jgi:riboflavin kinase